MTLLLLEALLAGVIFVGIVWWVMFAGRKGGERKVEPDRTDAPETRRSGRAEASRPDEPPPR